MFVAEGAHVSITGRAQEKLDAAAKQIGKGVTAIQGNMADMDDLDRLFARIKREQGKLDIVFANAGVAESVPLGTIEEAHFNRFFNSNVKGLLFSVQKAVPLLPDGAAIGLTGSVVGSKGLPGNTLLAATKAAVRSFARTWAMGLRERRIRVNVVSPGPVDTPGSRDLLGDSEANKQSRNALSQIVLLGRMGEVDEIVRAMLFLASTNSSYVTGAELFVDGGMGQV